MQEQLSQSRPLTGSASIMQAYSVINDNTDEERKKRNRIAKRKSRQRQGANIAAREEQEDRSLLPFSGGVRGTLVVSSRKICDEQEITTSYSREGVVDIGDTSLPVLPAAQLSHENANCSSAGKGYVLDAHALPDLTLLNCFRSTSTDAESSMWSSGGSVDMQLADLMDVPNLNSPSRMEIGSPPSLWANSTSELQLQLPQEQQQQQQQQRGPSSTKREPALHRAVISGEEHIVQLLLQHQANVNSHDKNGRTALDLAIDIGNVAIVQILLEHGADIEGN